jgi:hypothetical protein
VREIIREEISKALQLPPGATTTEITAGYLQALQRNGSARINGSAALPRDPYNNYLFGPGEPLFPEPISPLLPSGRPAPRQWEYPVTWNLQTTTTRAVPWTILRDISDSVSIVRSCIETCKSSLIGLDWSFGIDSTRARVVAKRSNLSPHQVTADMQDKFADDIERLHQWWLRPARGWTFTEWLTAILEDELVYDAVALYPRLTLSGDLLALEPIDSSTIKPLLDEGGRTPLPPLAAYQQILWGFPRGEYSPTPLEEVDGQYLDAVYGPLDVKGARTDTLIYKVRNKRTRSPYGYSCVEQALTDTDLWMRRWQWLVAEYSAGVTPEMVVQVEANMTPEQLRQYEAVFNDDLAGRTNERHRARFLPAGFHPSYPANMDAKFVSDLDLHLIRLVCAAFSVLPTSLGFTPNHNAGAMAGMSHQEGEQTSQLERGTKPRARWVVDIINEISMNWLGMPPEVTFTFHGLDDEDEEKEAKLLEGYLASGIMTLNETRDARNLPRFPFLNADEPFVHTPTGPAFFNPAAEPVGMPGNLPSAPQNQPHPKPARDEQVQDVPGAVARLEQKAFMTFARNNQRRETWRDFTFKAHSDEVADAANKLAAAGDIDAVKALFALCE